jgi:hypothetical protein
LPKYRCVLRRSDSANHGAARSRRFGLALVAALPALAASDAAAEPGAGELRLIAQSLGFLRQPPTGTQEVGIVYPTGSAAGRAAAERIAVVFGSGLSAGGLTLLPRVLTLDEAARGKPLATLVLTDDVLPQAARLAAAVAGKGVLTVTSDPEAVAAGAAVMAVRSLPRVEIFVSRAAAREAGVEFSTAFRMMIQER